MTVYTLPEPRKSVNPPHWADFPLAAKRLQARFDISASLAKAIADLAGFPGVRQ
jgi:hypothetical protein